MGIQINLKFMAVVTRSSAAARIATAEFIVFKSDIFQYQLFLLCLASNINDTNNAEVE